MWFTHLLIPHRHSKIRSRISAKKSYKFLLMIMRLCIKKDNVGKWWPNIQHAKKNILCLFLWMCLSVVGLDALTVPWNVGSHLQEIHSSHITRQLQHNYGRRTTVIITAIGTVFSQTKTSFLLSVATVSFLVILIFIKIMLRIYESKMTPCKQFIYIDNYCLS